MPIGERAARRRPRRRLLLRLRPSPSPSPSPSPPRPSLRLRPRQRCGRGFTYVLLLFSVALMGAALAALGTQWQLAGQREREAELLFRGLQIRDALQRFNALTPAGTRGLPLSLDELLVDRRALEPRFHLRRLYADPFSGQADWALLREAGGGIVGVHSRSQRLALRRHDLPIASLAAGPAVAGAVASGQDLMGLQAPGAEDRTPTAESRPAEFKPTESKTTAPQTTESAAAPPRLADWQFRIQPQMTVPRKPP